MPAMAPSMMLMASAKHTEKRPMSARDAIVSVIFDSRVDGAKLPYPIELTMVSAKKMEPLHSQL